MHPPEPDDAQGRYVVVGMLATLALLLAGVTAFVVFADEPAKAEPRIVVLPMREPEVEPPKAPASLVQPEPVEAEQPPGATRQGCGKEPPHRRRDTMIMPGRKITVYVPTRYDPAEARPLVLLFHDDHQTANGFFWDTGFEAVAEEHNILLALPRDQDLEHWRDPADILVGAEALEFVDSILCVDSERIYGVGNGSGGDLVERLACELPLQAIATTTHRSGVQPACPDRPIPYLHIASLEDGYLPPDGDGCLGTVPTLDSHEAAWRSKNRCEERRQKYFREGRHQCWSYPCDASFVSCHLAAGRGWPLQDKPRTLDVLGCDGDPPTDFPLAAVTWRFFASHAP